LKLIIILIILFTSTSCAKIKYASTKDLEGKSHGFIETNKHGHLIQSFVVGATVKNKQAVPDNWYLKKSKYTISTDVEKNDLIIIVNNHIIKLVPEGFISK